MMKPSYCTLSTKRGDTRRAVLAFDWHHHDARHNLETDERTRQGHHDRGPHLL